LVAGYFAFFNEWRALTELTKQATSGCATIRLAPGYYEVGAGYYQGPVCSNTSAGCKSDRQVFEILPDQVIEADFEVFPAGS
jgi:hypothetical protein